MNSWINVVTEPLGLTLLLLTSLLQDPNRPTDHALAIDAVACLASALENHNQYECGVFLELWVSYLAGTRNGRLESPYTVARRSGASGASLDPQEDATKSEAALIALTRPSQPIPCPLPVWAFLKRAGDTTHRLLSSTARPWR